MRDRLRHERSQAFAAGICGVLTCLSLSAGCGTGAPPVPDGAHVQRITGKVTTGKGEPVGAGKVVLTPQQEPREPLSGWLDSDGSFTLMESQGLAISHGEFLVHIEPPALPNELDKSPQAHAKQARLQKGQQVPARFQKPETSKIKVTIGPDTKQLPPIMLK
jgi:hypothetical protein